MTYWPLEMYEDTARANLLPATIDLVDDIVQVGIATREQGDELLRRMVHREGLRLQARDEAITRKQQSRRGFARLLNLGQ